MGVLVMLRAGAQTHECKTVTFSIFHIHLCISTRMVRQFSMYHLIQMCGMTITRI